MVSSTPFQIMAWLSESYLDDLVYISSAYEKLNTACFNMLDDASWSNGQDAYT